MISRKHFTYIAVLLVTLMCTCVGCSSERLERQKELRELGILQLKNEQYELALESFQLALDESLGNIGEMELDLCLYKAKTQYLLGDVEGAIGTYTSVIGYNNSPKAYYLRGTVYLDRAEFYANPENGATADADYVKLAFSDFNTATIYDPKSYDLFIGIYDALTDHGALLTPEQTHKAIEYLYKALEIPGETAYDKMQKGWIQFILGKNQEALTLLTDAVSQGQEPNAYYCLAQVCLAMGDGEAAKTNMEDYIATGIADSYKLFDIAEAQMAKKNYDVAITCLEAAMELEDLPNKQVIMRTLAIAYENVAQFDKAKSILSAYVNLYPSDEEAKRELTFLETR